MNYNKTAYAIFKDKVNKDNINEVLEEWNDFISHGNKNDRKNVNSLVKEIEGYLYDASKDGKKIIKTILKKNYKNILIKNKICMIGINHLINFCKK